MWNKAYQRARKAARAVIGKIRAMGYQKMGWYAALALLLVGLGAASYGWRNRNSRVEPVEPAPMAALAGVTPSPVDRLTALPTPAPTPEPLTFEWPVSGEILGSFSPDALVWSETLGQWQTHPAIDIAAEAGEAVCACAEGVVSDAWEDALWGKVIQIEHPEGYVSTYANLSTLKLVKVGDAVTAGQTISAVGSSAACEVEMPWHLHFSLTREGEPVDFEKNMLQNDA